MILNIVFVEQNKNNSHSQFFLKMLTTKVIFLAKHCKVDLAFKENLVVCFSFVFNKILINNIKSPNNKDSTRFVSFTYIYPFHWRTQWIL